MENNFATNNFLAVADISAGGNLSHKDLMGIIKTTIKDSTIKNYLKGFSRKKLLSQPSTMTE